MKCVSRYTGRVFVALNYAKSILEVSQEVAYDIMYVSDDCLELAS